MEENQGALFIVFISVMCVCNCFHSMPIACNVSRTDYCPASLYFVPTKPISIEETAALFRVNAGAINKTVDGFAIMVNCSCPAEHDWFVWRTDYTIEWGDTWESISLKFGSFVVKKPEKQLFDSQTVTLDLLCGCSKGQRVVTYRVVTGDTLFTICSRFGADLNETEQLNRLPNPSLIHSGDVVFIPTSGRGPFALFFFLSLFQIRNDMISLNIKKVYNKSEIHTVGGRLYETKCVLPQH